jgi:putative SOS response-associated peptidase YedK
MCGRFTIIRLQDFLNLFPWIRSPDSQPPPRYNVAPSQAVAVVPNKPDPKVDFFSWGLVPSWAKDRSIGHKTINARAETLADKPMFRSALRRRRCIIPADGFYEWKRNPDGKTKTPLYITLKAGRPFAFAGLWEIWHDPGGSVLPTFTIITTPPNDLMKTIHDRMPAILRPEDYHAWLEPAERDPADLQPLLAPYPADEMEARPVSRLVNNPRHEAPDCIASPAEEPPSGRHPTTNPSDSLFP